MFLNLRFACGDAESSWSASFDENFTQPRDNSLFTCSYYAGARRCIYILHSTLARAVSFVFSARESVYSSTMSCRARQLG